MSILLTVLVAMGAVAALFFRTTSNLAERVIQSRLAQSNQAIADYKADVRDKLITINAYISGNAVFKAYMLEAMSSGSTDSIIDQYDEIRRFSGCDFMLVTDEQGQVVVDTRQNAGAVQVVDLPRSLEESVGVWSDSNGLNYVVASPLESGGAVFGYVLVGYRLGDALAQRIGRLTDCGIYFLRPKGDSTALAGSYLAEGMEWIASNPQSESQLFSGLIGLVPNAENGKTVSLSISGGAFEAMMGTFENWNGKPVGYYAAVKSIDRERAPFTQLMKYGGLILLAALILMVPLSMVVSRSITGPLRSLVSVIDGVRQGQFQESAIQVKSKDEVGRMAVAFKEMVRELREQNEMIHFLERSKLQSLSPVEIGNPTLPASDLQMSATEDGALQPGQVLASRYRILQTLGKGAMGLVYRVQDLELDEVVALKMIYLQDPGIREMLKNETKLARRVTNRHVVRTFDYGTFHNVQFVTMEYVDGVTLKHVLQRHKLLPLEIGLRTVKQICQGLHAAHEGGVIHGDVKPENIMVSSRGLIKVMDFGVARISKAGSQKTDLVTGTPLYMAPEQIYGKPLDFRTDLYSVGVIMFQVFTGTIPFQAENMAGIFRKHLEVTPPPPSSVNRRLPPSLDQIILCALAKNPAERFPSMRDLFEALDQVARQT
ncbi:MAG: protein kinase [Acidobacteria bacterium]|nr:protein kinase [Acidobacteriota bacterium]MCB9398793.1 protein kinase [Acidobacteriota bacterium]